MILAALLLALSLVQAESNDDVQRRTLQAGAYFGAGITWVSDLDRDGVRDIAVSSKGGYGDFRGGVCWFSSRTGECLGTIVIPVGHSLISSELLFLGSFQLGDERTESNSIVACVGRRTVADERGAFLTLLLLDMASRRLMTTIDLPTLVGVRPEVSLTLGTSGAKAKPPVWLAYRHEGEDRARTAGVLGVELTTKVVHPVVVERRVECDRGDAVHVRPIAHADLESPTLAWIAGSQVRIVRTGSRQSEIVLSRPSSSSSTATPTSMQVEPGIGASHPRVVVGWQWTNDANRLVGEVVWYDAITADVLMESNVSMDLDGVAHRLSLIDGGATGRPMDVLVSQYTAIFGSSPFVLSGTNAQRVGSAIIEYDDSPPLGWQMEVGADCDGDGRPDCLVSKFDPGAIGRRGQGVVLISTGKQRQLLEITREQGTR